jgi:glycosyltransferase involved in cell wall biosynthesis
MCPKPIHVQLKTGWFSDRSIAYLASGRPVVAEETGFSERIPTGVGLLSFRDIAEAAAGIAEIDSNYQRHSRAAREIAEAFFDTRKCLEALLSACEP